MTGRTGSTHPKPLWRGVVRLLSPEPEGAANGGEHRGDRRLIQPGVLAGPRDGVAGLLLPESLCKLPDAPTENCVAPIDDSHVPPFRCPSLPMHLRHKRRRRRWGTMIPYEERPCRPPIPDFLRLLRRLVLAGRAGIEGARQLRSEEHTSELQSRENLVCRLL